MSMKRLVSLKECLNFLVFVSSTLAMTPIAAANLYTDCEDCDTAKGSNQPMSSAVSSCTWPMLAVVNLKNASDYPTSVLLLFSKTNSNSDLITIKETIQISLAKVARDYPGIIQSSEGWGEMQSRLDCQNRAGNFSYGLGVSGDKLIATFAATVEKYWCVSADVPCPTTQEPFRLCRQESNGKLWGANVSSSNTIGLQQDHSNGFKAAVISTSTSSNTSAEQNFIRDLLGGALLGPIGISLVREMETSALDGIKNGMRHGFDGKSFSLPNGAEAPEIPNYAPKFVRSYFRSSPLTFIDAVIERQVPEYRESTGCFIARKLGATRIPTGPRPGRN